MQRIYALRKQAKENGEPILRDKSFELLLQVCKENLPSKILEIGTNVGLSGIAMLLTLKDATLSGIEIDEDKILAAKQNYKEFGVQDRAKIFCGDASQIIPILTGPYDLIFLDGPKGHYAEYLPHLLSILSVGGIIFADNVLFKGYVNGKVKTPKKHNTIKNSMERYIKAITADENLSTKLLDLEDGVSITKKLK